jgi:hypothetical protein
MLLIGKLVRNYFSQFLVVFIVLVGCKERTTETEINKFEKELGLEVADGLTKVVVYFDNLLLNKYPDLALEKAYEKHLEFIMEAEVLSINEWLQAQFRKDSIFNLYSNNLIEEIWIQPDSVWVRDSKLLKVYRGKSSASEREIRDRIKNYDSLVYFEQNVETFNIRGKYLGAFQKIAESNEIAEWYYDMKYHAGSISPHITAQTFLNSRVDLDDYLVKRIILIETFTNFISFE